MSLKASRGGVWSVRMLSAIKQWDLKAGDIVEVPLRVRDQIALRWIADGKAERYEAPAAKAKNKMAGRAKGTKLVEPA